MGWLWLLQEDGVPYRVPATTRPEASADIAWSREPVTVDDEQVSILQLAASSAAAYALDADGAVYVFRHPAVLLVRRSLEVFQNQRWYPVVGWRRPLPTDWAQISTSDGHRMDFENSLPSIGWRWEDNWDVQKETNTDREGWQYAPLFAKAVSWRSSSGIGSFVRRRRWKRLMRYVASAKWIPIPNDGRCFNSIAAGCSTASPNGGCLLFAVGVDRALYRRCISQDLPEGDEWVRMEDIRYGGGPCGDGWETVEHGSEREDVVLFACSPTYPTLLAVTWNGTLYFRMGISSAAPSGTTWRMLSTPDDRPATAVTIGSDAMWVTTADGQLWMHRLELDSHQSSHDLTRIRSQTYRNLGSGSSQPAVSSDDQLLVIQGGKIAIRDGITPNEITGKCFVPLIERTEKECSKWTMICASSLVIDRIPAHWISNVTFMETSDVAFKTAEWRRKILDSLVQLNEKSWDIFQQHSNESAPRIEEDGWQRSVKAKLRLPTDDGYTDGSLTLFDDKFCASAGKVKLEVNLDKVLRAGKSFELVPFNYCITMHIDFPATGTCIRAAFASEKERDDWHEALQTVIRKIHSISPRDVKPSACWTIGGFGYPRLHPLNELILDAKQNPNPRPWNQLRSIDVEGHFKAISAGAEGVVWALTEEGQPYVLSPLWDPFDERGSAPNLEQTDSVIVSALETYRYQLFRGFVPYCCNVSGIGPLKETRITHGWQGGMRLPSHDWSWEDGRWRLENGEVDDGWSFSVDLNGPYGDATGKAHFRRRKWTRRARYKAMTPWIWVDSPQLKSVSVQRDEGDRILVWGLTTEGEVLVRQGVQRDRPQGYVWKQIICNSPLTALTIISPTEVCAISAKGKIFVRSCEDQIDIESIDWIERDLPIPPGQFSSLLIQEKGDIWFIDRGVLHLVTAPKNDLHRLCTLAEPCSLSLDPYNRVVVIEGGQANRHHDWLKTEVKKGRRSSFMYSCKKREPLETGYTNFISFTRI